MSNHLQEAVSLLGLADGREGPEDARHATQLVIARALISLAKSQINIADSLEHLVRSQDPAWLNDVLNERSEAVHLLNDLLNVSTFDSTTRARAEKWLAERE